MLATELVDTRALWRQHTVPLMNDWAPRQNRPPYPALGRPAAVGLPMWTVSPETFAIAVS